MMSAFILLEVHDQLARRTIYLPESIEALARSSAREGESFSATVARLIENGAQSSGRPSYVGVGEGPEDLGLAAEKHLVQIFEEFSD
jgi:hypothetical protein